MHLAGSISQPTKYYSSTATATVEFSSTRKLPVCASPSLLFQKCIQECHCQVQNILHYHALSFLRLFLSHALSQPSEFNMQSNGSRMGRRGKSFSQFPLTRDYQSIKALVFGARESVVRCACSPQPCLTRISVSD